MTPHQHHHRHARRHPGPGVGNEKTAKQPNNQVATLVSVVFVTASQTFDGEIASYVTMGSTSPSPLPSQPQITSDTPTAQLTTSDMPSPLPTSGNVDPSVAAISIALVGTLPPDTTAPSNAPSTSLPTSSPDPVHQTVKTTPSATAGIATLTAAVPSSSVSVDAISATQSTADPAAVSQLSTGISGGAKAGIAIGVILGLAALIGLLAYCYRRRKQQKNQAYEHTEDEKNPFGDNAAAPAPAHAVTPPQLSLRPVTQFEPEFVGAKTPTNPAPAPAVPPHFENRDLEKVPSETGNEHGYSAEAAPVNPEVPAPLRVGTPPSDLPANAAGFGTLAAGATANVAQRHNGPKPLEIRRGASPTPRSIEQSMPSPTGTEFSMTSVSTNNIGNGSPPTNVHRIQLDFKPSMADEIELKAGQLVRLLHEYDDGWALCVRLDRSQQGVAPRTCLSTRPVKPRSKPPPRGPLMPIPRLPVQAQMPPHNPGSSPALASLGTTPKAPLLLSAQQQRSVSPANVAPVVTRRRSNSAGNIPGESNDRLVPGPQKLDTESNIPDCGNAQEQINPQKAATSPTTSSRPQTSGGVQRKPLPSKAT